MAIICPQLPTPLTHPLMDARCRPISDLAVVDICDMKRDLTEEPLIIKKPRGKWCFNLGLACSLPARSLPFLSVCPVNGRREESEGPKPDQDAI